MKYNYDIYKNQLEYERNFWDVMRGKVIDLSKLSGGRNINNGTFDLPTSSTAKLNTIIQKLYEDNILMKDFLK